MTHSLDLPDHVYQVIRRAAELEGLTPTEWIEAAVSRAVTPDLPEKENDRPLSEVLQGLVGSFDSSKERYEGRAMSRMTEIVANKLEKQGIDVPWRRQP